MVKVLNVKQNNNSPDYAVYLVDCEIKDSVKTGANVFIVVHGYGSSGKGGIMKQQVISFLQEQVKFKKIKAYIQGQQWAQTNDVVNQMQQLYPQLLLNSQIKHLHSSVSVVWVQ